MQICGSAQDELHPTPVLLTEKGQELPGNTEKAQQRTQVPLFCCQSPFQSDMAKMTLKDEFENQFNDVLTRLQSKELFQSDWDIASFAVFFIFIGMVLLLVVLVLIRCCCCCCCDGDEKPRRHKVGMDNMALEP